MKHLILSLLSVSLVSCANVSTCKLPAGVKPFPKCHPSPPTLTWTNGDGMKLPYLQALPKSGKPKAVVILVPGADGVTGDYASITKELTQHGYAVYGCENRSFVYGPAKNRANPKDWRPWVKDLQGFNHFVRTRHPGTPVFWHGHSFGAVEVLAALADTPVNEAPKGLIIHSPAIALMPKKVDFLKAILVGSIAWVRIPHLRMMDRDRDDLRMTTEEQWDCQWKHSEDRTREGIKVRFAIQATRMGIQARQGAKQIRLPVLAMWGGRDRVSLGGKEALRGEYEYFLKEEIADGQATPFPFEEGQHLLTEGATKKDALTAIITWLDGQ